MAISPAAILPFLKGTRPYALYVLCVLMVVFMLNQKDRFLLGVTGRVVAKDLGFGDRSCVPHVPAMNNKSNISSSTLCDGECLEIRHEEDCTEDRGVHCVWDHTPLGLKYELLAGPFFTFVFTLSTIPLGILASNRWVNRRMTLSIFLVFWSCMTLTTAFTHKYWQFLLARLGLGLFEAVCTPFASSVISDYFQEKYRGTALGFYNWGIYLGYSVAFSFEFVLNSLGWRWVYRIASIPGFAVALLMLLSVREPARQYQHQSKMVSVRGKSLIKKVLQAYLQPALILMCVAGGIRLGAGLVWAYNVKTYFNQLYCGVDVGVYLSWVPIVGGTLGALLGGLMSDRLARLNGYKGRMWVLIFSQICATPFLVGTLYLHPIPWAFISLIPAYIIGEAWLGICLTIAIELVPIEVSPASIALFLFISNNISSVMPLLLPVLKDYYGLQRAMLVLFPGLYVISAALFCVSLALLIASDSCKDRVKSKPPARVKEASRQRRRRRVQGRILESSPLLEEATDRNYSVQGSESDSDLDDFVEVDERQQREAQEALESATAAVSGGDQQRPIMIHPSTVDNDGEGAKGRGRGRGRGRGYGAVETRVAGPAPVTGSVSEWSVLPLSAEKKCWLAESQEGI